MRGRDVVGEVVGDSTVEVSQHTSRGFLMNILTISSLGERAVERVALVLRGKAKVGGATRVVVMGNPSSAIIVAAHSIS